MAASGDGHHADMDTHTRPSPLPSSIAADPYRVAPDTWVIPEVFPAAPGIFVPINSLVIAGREPVIVDTGTHLNQRRWLDQIFSIVDPAAVRWVFLSHDDHDHVGSLPAVLDACPNATLVTTWFTVERLRGDYGLPMDRMRWVNDGESFHVGDRTLVAITPPIFDSPTSRGLFDARTGVYWAVDAFACLLTDPAMTDVAELDAGFWRDGLLDNNRMISPWHTLLDPRKFDRHVDKIATLPIQTIASAHSVAVHGEQVADAIRLIRQVARMDAAALPGQGDLEALLAMLAGDQTPVPATP